MKIRKAQRNEEERYKEYLSSKKVKRPSTKEKREEIKSMQIALVLQPTFTSAISGSGKVVILRIEKEIPIRHKINNESRHLVL